MDRAYFRDMLIFEPMLIFARVRYSIFFQANLGNLDRKDEAMSLIVSNLALVQCQGIVVGFVASLVAIVMDAMKGGDIDLDHTLLLCASSVVTASIASFALGLVMVSIQFQSAVFK